ncbi:glycosyltransferase [Limosilactobacillus mucosae]|uniref:glycosyltransferase n=1 Tax=Limosilactobacillus mucosae TaxID=97478 RepID=UPI0022E681A8|nr:glycosyltransferase [Limosilactobacillus mucosae]
MISQIIFETSFAGLIIYLVWVCFLLALGQNSQSDKVELGFDQSYRLVILVPAMNEEAVIKQTVQLFLKEAHQLENVKMVIIDDASDDQTAAVVKRFISQTGQERIQLLQRQHPNAQTGKGNALN